MKVWMGAALMAWSCAETPDHAASRAELVAAPANDDAAGAELIACGGSAAGSTSNASIDDAAFCGTSVSAPGVWYRFVGDGSNVTLSTCNAADYDTKISVYAGSSFTCVTGRDDSVGCGLFTTEVSVCTTPGEEYFVLVHGFASQTGNFTLSMSCAPPATNDDACDAAPLALGTSSFSNACATAEPGEATPPAGSGIPCDSQDGWCDFPAGIEPGVQSSVWFALSAPSSRALTIQTAGFDTQLALWEANACGDLTSGGATLVAANDDGAGNLASLIGPTYCLDPSATYFVQIDGWSGTTGDGTITVAEVDPTVTICHRGQTISVDSCALPAHLGHEDSLGACPESCQANQRVEICHHPEGKNPVTIDVSSCALRAHLEHGDATGACGVPGACVHGLCEAGAALDPACDPCVASICAADPFCCSSGWDSICVGEVSTICQLPICGGTTCAPDEVIDCFGACAPAALIGNGVCDPMFDCPAFNYDAGDCTGAPCAPGDVLDCFGGCSPSSWIGDGICDPMLDCPEHNNDGGDCPAPPPPAP